MGVRLVIQAEVALIVGAVHRLAQRTQHHGLDQVEIRTVLDQAGEYLDTARKDAILTAYASRLERLMELSQMQVKEDKLGEDVEQDIAQNYERSHMDLI